MASCYADTAPPEVFNWQLAAGDRRLISPPPLTFNRQCVRGTGYRCTGAWIGEEKRQRTLILHRPGVLQRRERSATVLHVKKKKKVSIPFTLHMFVVARLCSQQQGLSVLRQKPLIIVGQRQIGGVRKAKPIFQLSLIHIFTVQQKFISCGWDANYN